MPDKQSADIIKLRRALAAGAQMRTGRKLGRTLYLVDPFVNPADPDRDICIGIVDDFALAEEIVRVWNKSEMV